MLKYFCTAPKTVCRRLPGGGLVGGKAAPGGEVWRGCPPLSTRMVGKLLKICSKKAWFQTIFRLSHGCSNTFARKCTSTRYMTELRSSPPTLYPFSQITLFVPLNELTYQKSGKNLPVRSTSRQKPLKLTLVWQQNPRAILSTRIGNDCIWKPQAVDLLSLEAFFSSVVWPIHNVLMNVKSTHVCVLTEWRTSQNSLFYIFRKVTFTSRPRNAAAHRSQAQETKPNKAHVSGLEEPRWQLQWRWGCARHKWQ